MKITQGVRFSLLGGFQTSIHTKRYLFFAAWGCQTSIQSKIVHVSAYVSAPRLLRACSLLHLVPKMSTDQTSIQAQSAHAVFPVRSCKTSIQAKRYVVLYVWGLPDVDPVKKDTCCFSLLGAARRRSNQESTCFLLGLELPEPFLCNKTVRIVTNALLNTTKNAMKPSES